MFGSRRRRPGGTGDSPPAPSVSCKEATLALLGRRQYTRRELEVRLLRKGYGPEEVEAVLASLAERGWVDDAKAAASLVRAGEARGRGRARIAQGLAARGVPRKDAEEALSAVDPAAEAARLREVLRRRARSLPAGLTAEARSKRLFDHLVRRGFAPGAVRAALREKGDLPDDPES